MSSFKPIYLDVDSSIVENNLRITNDSNDELTKIFGNTSKEYPSKLVKPHPGFCVKTKEDGTDTKVFVNICTTEAIPPPKEISEMELIEIIESEEASDYRVPMSIGEIRSEKDKKGNEAKAVDIAINDSFLKKIQTYQTFKNFFMAVVFQGLENKYGLICADEKIILQNKKAFGTLQTHRIQQREMDEKMGKIKEDNSLIQELTGNNTEFKKPSIETISSTEHATKEPEYRLYKKKKVGSNCLTGEFKFPDVISANELTLDVGEDRILIESTTKGYLLDIFVPYFIRTEKCLSSFDKASKILTVSMPLVGG